MFCECHISKNFYLQIKSWAKNFGLEMPSLGLQILYIGAGNSRYTALLNMLMLAYKFMVFNNRTNLAPLSMDQYVTKLTRFEYLERKVAEKRHKIIIHEIKWKPIPQNILIKKRYDNQ